MLKVTPEAQQWIVNQLDEAKAPQAFALRLFDEEGTILMSAAEPKKDDQLFETGERVYLAVAPRAATKLQGKALCCQETDKGASLAIASAPPA